MIQDITEDLQLQEHQLETFVEQILQYIKEDKVEWDFLLDDEKILDIERQISYEFNNTIYRIDLLFITEVSGNEFMYIIELKRGKLNYSALDQALTYKDTLIKYINNRKSSDQDDWDPHKVKIVLIGTEFPDDHPHVYEEHCTMFKASLNALSGLTLTRYS